MVHRHSSVQVVLPTVGRLDLVVEGERGHVGGGQLAVVRPSAEHVSWADDPARCLVVDLSSAVLIEAQDGALAIAARPFRMLDECRTALDRLLRAELRFGGLADRLLAGNLGRYAARILTLDPAFGPTQAISPRTGARPAASASCSMPASPRISR